MISNPWTRKITPSVQHHNTEWIAEFHFSITLYPTAEKKRVEIGHFQVTMNTNSKKNGPISRYQPFQLCSVVGNKLPLVGSSSPVNLAFLGHEQPLVTINRQLGFTLMELIITLVIAAILVSLAVPNMRTFIQNGRISTQANDFVTDITYARSEAIKRGTNVALCASTSGTACTSVAGNWEIGHMIFADSDNSNTWSGSPTDTPLRFREAMGGTNNTLRGVPGPLVFNSQGFLIWAGVGPIPIPPGALPYTFNLCDDRGTSRGRAITLNWTGQVRVLPSSSPPASCP